MVKKLIDEEFEEFDSEMDEVVPEIKIEEELESASDIDSDIEINDDDDNIDLIIEINDEDLDLTIDESDIKTDVEPIEPDDVVLSKHKIEGKHSLKYDSIFKGKKEDPIEEDDVESGSYRKDTIEVDRTSNYYAESIENEKYTRTKLIKERVYSVLIDNTAINFLNNRRKPSRIDFNQYYNLLRLNLKEEGFTNIELFNELAVYFSDNLFNMFKLLDKRWRNLIIGELQDHIGKNLNSKEITNRNIYDGTEIEFEWFDELNSTLLTITGVVIEVDYDNSLFKVNSYENIYDIDITMITKILNNTKFKYNLNKLNNIDFL